MDDMLIRFGKCCQPVPGDPIIGYITRGYGVSIHRANCVNAMKLSPDRQIEADWDNQSSETYPVKIRVRSYDRVGLLADIAANISKNEANILSLNTQTYENKAVVSLFTLAVEDTDHLERVLSAIRKVRLVKEVRRVG
jgi:GTP pyrophosphokinase